MATGSSFLTMQAAFRASPDYARWQQAMSRIVSGQGAMGVKVGVFEGATTEYGESVATYAACNEFGTSEIPSRPFMRKTIRENVGKWADMFVQATQGQWITDPNTAERAFKFIGRQAALDVQDTIKSSLPPPNAPETQERKASRPGGGYAGTLYDSGNLYQSIGFEIVDQNGNTLKEVEYTAAGGR